jgi:propionyl-CoA carboxylase alpha chain
VSTVARTPITSVLVANRGEIARRIIRTARAMGIRTVAVFVEADAGAPFVTEADGAIRIETRYLDGGAVLAAARASGADAIHPGYGFLSENAAFARQVAEAGITWIGPTPEVIDAMGDKITAKRAAEAAGVPTLPSTEDPAAADEVGYPLLVKASAGGGGKGMRIVERAEDLDESLAAARREALSGFGDDRVFLERYVARSRHVEIQILGDQHGTVVHLGERECSIQRRHQKVIEESPSPVVDEAMRAAMGEAALGLARAIGYTSTGTVEFLVDDETREFFFLEVNTRLQVEHPVTEEVTGIDLVREQFRVAAGEPLDPSTAQAAFAGHAIEARLYAEDPAAGFLPATGTVVAFAPADEPAVRWDSGVVPGSVVGVDFDPMLAKVVAHAPTRTEAALRLALALERLHLGGVTTNRDFLVAALRAPAFLAGDTTTDFIERVGVALARDPDPVEHARTAAAAALWLQGRNRAEAPVLATMPSGWRNTRTPAQSASFLVDGDPVDTTYRRLRDGTFEIDGGAWSARIHGWSPCHIDLEQAGHRAVVLVTAAGDDLYLQVPRGTAHVVVRPRFVVPGPTEVAGGFTAPMPGVVLDVRVEAGQRVAAGQTLVVLEAMKMEHHMAAPADGVVAEVRVAAGEQVENGALLLVFEPDDSITAGTGGEDA